MENKGKFKVFMLFGEEPVDRYENGEFDELAEVLMYHAGDLVCREFETEAEKNAYLQGIEDYDGWRCSAEITEEEIKAHPRIMKKLCGLN